MARGDFWEVVNKLEKEGFKVDIIPPGKDELIVEGELKICLFLTLIIWLFPFKYRGRGGIIILRGSLG